MATAMEPPVMIHAQMGLRQTVMMAMIRSILVQRMCIVTAQIRIVPEQTLV